MVLSQEELEKWEQKLLTTINDLLGLGLELRQLLGGHFPIELPNLQDISLEDSNDVEIYD